MEKIYNLRKIRELLTDGFSARELRCFCFDEKDFRPVYDKLSETTGKEEIIDYLIEFAERRLLIDKLLDWAKKVNPARYQLYQPYDLVVKSELAIREKLSQFFNLKGDNHKITLFLSRHSAITELPPIPPGCADSKIRERTDEIEREEARLRKEGQLIIPAPFTVVSAVEMLEVSWLKDIIERPELRDWFPIDSLLTEIKEKLLKTPIEVNVEVCPESDECEKILAEGTKIFIGGPRANWGTFYYLFGLEAGEVRPTRPPRKLCPEVTDQGQPSRPWTKDIVECINNPDKEIHRCNGHNLAIIQKYKFGNDTIIYLAGTGANGTAAAVAYLRKHWLDLLEKCDGDGNFFKVIDVPGRGVLEEDLANYRSDYWSEKWIEVELVCD